MVLNKSVSIDLEFEVPLRIKIDFEMNLRKEIGRFAKFVAAHNLRSILLRFLISCVIMSFSILHHAGVAYLLFALYVSVVLVCRLDSAWSYGLALVFLGVVVLLLAFSFSIGAAQTVSYAFGFLAIGVLSSVLNDSKVFMGVEKE